MGKRRKNKLICDVCYGSKKVEIPKNSAFKNNHEKPFFIGCPRCTK